MSQPFDVALVETLEDVQLQVANFILNSNCSFYICIVMLPHLYLLPPFSPTPLLVGAIYELYIIFKLYISCLYIAGNLKILPTTKYFDLQIFPLENIFTRDFFHLKTFSFEKIFPPQQIST